MLDVFTIDGKPVTLEKEQDNTYKLTKEQLDKLLEAAYAAGKRAGSGTYIPYYPNITGPTTDPNKGWRDWDIRWTCGDPIPCGFSGTGQVYVTTEPKAETKTTTKKEPKVQYHNSAEMLH